MLEFPDKEKPLVYSAVLSEAAHPHKVHIKVGHTAPAPACACVPPPSCPPAGPHATRNACALGPLASHAPGRGRAI